MGGSGTVELGKFLYDVANKRYKRVKGRAGRVSLQRRLKKVDSILHHAR